MSRRGHDLVEEREVYASRREAPRSRAPVTEYDEVDIRERRRTRDEPEFLQDGYGRNSQVGQLIVRERSRSRDRHGTSTVGRSRGDLEIKEDVVIRGKSRDRPRKRDLRAEEETIIRERSSDPPRRREIVEEDIVISTRDRERDNPRLKEVKKDEEIIISDRSSDRPRRRDVTDEEIIIQTRDADRDRSRAVNETIIYPDYDPRPQVRREYEDFVYRERLDGRGRDEHFVPPPRSNRGHDVRFEREDYEFAERRREPSPAPVIREEIIIRDEEKEKPRRREERDEEIIIRERERERPRFREERDEEIIIKERERERPRFREDRDEEIIIRERERERPRYADDREEEIIIQRREKEREEPRHHDDHSHEIVIRERSRERPRYRDEIDEEIYIRERERDRSHYRDDTYDEISIREREPDRRGYRDDREEIIIRERERERERPRQREERDETIIIRKEDKSRDPPISRRRDIEEEEITIRESRRDRVRLKPRRSFDRDTLYAEHDRSRPKSRSDFEENEIIIRHNTNASRGPSPTRSIRRNDYRDEEISIRRGDRERDIPRRRDKSRDREEEDITIRHNDDGHGRHSDQIIIKRNERSPSPVAAPTPPPVLEPVRAPPVIQEVITHHRHIDHGFERAPESPRLAPPRRRTPSPVEDERIQIRHRSKSHGRVHEDSINIEIDHNEGRRHEGVHHGRGNNEAEGRELALVDRRDPRHYIKQADPKDRLWTEITVDLVSEEAIKEMGYEYNRSGGNYYVYKYLKYEDVQALVDLTEDINRDRRDRVRGIRDERDFRRDEGPRRLTGPGHQWDEERVVEREIIYDEGNRRRRF